MREMCLHSFKRKTSLHVVQSCALNYLESLECPKDHTTRNSCKIGEKLAGAGEGFPINACSPSSEFPIG